MGFFEEQPWLLVVLIVAVNLGIGGIKLSWRSWRSSQRRFRIAR